MEAKTIKEAAIEHAIIFDRDSPRSHVDHEKHNSFIAGAVYILGLLEDEFISDTIPDTSSCCYQYEMKEFINKLIGK